MPPPAKKRRLRVSNLARINLSNTSQHPYENPIRAFTLHSCNYFPAASATHSQLPQPMHLSLVGYIHTYVWNDLGFTD